MVTLPVTAVAQERPPGDPAALSRAKDVDGKDMVVAPIPPDPAWEQQVRGKPVVTWPAAATGEVNLAPAVASAARAGESPVTLRTSTPDQDGTPSPAKVRVNLMDRAKAETLGAKGVLVELKRADGKAGQGPVDLEVDYSGFRRAYGGDFAARLRIVALPACALTDPAKPACRQQITIPSRNDVKAGKAVARTSVTPEGSLFALDSAPSGQTGDYKATSLAPSTTWTVGNNSGSFSLSHPLPVPQVPGGLVPEFTMAYNSGSVDGRTASTNNQVSWLGEGWDMWSGYVEWRFKGCSDDGVTSQETGDMCWAGDHASISFGGRSSELLYDPDKKLWRLREDDNSRVELLSGAANGDNGNQYWRVTTSDGKQYHFGFKPETQSTWTVPVFGNNSGEPCYSTAGFAQSWCHQAWRWQLDYVVDRAGNTITYFYNKETNSYGLNMAKSKIDYTRGGTLDRAEYGSRLTAPATAQVKFETADRCQADSDCSKHVKESYPDVPYDQECTDDKCAGKVTPTFWSTKRLAKVTTSVSGAVSDTWTMEQSFPATGDTSDPALWLQKVTRVGSAGGQQTPIPPMEFRGTPEPNRMNTPEDGLLPMQKYRIHTVHNESGGRTEVNWAADDCVPGQWPKKDTNQQRCFPVRWAQKGAVDKDDWFRKYVVKEVNADERVGGGKIERTSYEYSGGGAWHYNDDPLLKAEFKSWSQWRGYDRVKVRTGNVDSEPGVKQTEKEFRYFRGMKGDKLDGNPDGKPAQVEDSANAKHDDLDGLQGFLLEERTLDGKDGPEVSGTRNQPHLVHTATKGTAKAYLVRTLKTFGRTKLAAGGVRQSETVNEFDEDYNVKKVSDLGDVAKRDDEQCTTTTYAKNRGSWILDLPSQVTRVGVECGAAAVFPRDAISDERTYYDGSTELGAAPTSGFVTRKEKVKEYVGGVPKFIVDSVSTFDAYGRPLTVSDVLERTNRTTYDPPVGPPAKVVAKDPAGNETVTELKPWFTDPVSTTDVNNRRTDLSYDGFGRLTAVWMPGRPRGEAPNLRFTYTIRNDGTSTVATEALKAKLNTLTSYTLYDGFLRQRQTQKPAWLEGGRTGRVVTDTIYDSRGLEVKRNGEYFDDAAAAGPKLFLPTSGDAQIPSQTVLTYDGAAREIKSELFSQGRALSSTWSTKTEHGGDHTVVTPPKGGTPTVTYKDVRDQTTELRQLHGVVGEQPPTTKYGYDKAGRLATVTDPAGNVWSYAYDVRGRQTEVRDPDKGLSEMTYDDADQLIERKDARGQVIVTKYDKLGRPTETRKDSATGDPLTVKTYDTVPGAVGQLATSTRYAGGREYKTEIVSYDDAYNVTEKTVKIPDTEPGLAGTYRAKAAYSTEGALIWENVPKLGNDLGGEEINYRYDDFGKLSFVGNDNNSYVGYARYTEFGELEMIRRGKVNNEAWTLKDYAPATRRLSQISVETRPTVGSQADLRYGYDEEGNVTSLSMAVPKEKIDRQCFGYDGLKRLTEVWTAGSTTANDCALGAGKTVDGPAPYWTTYKYDAIGNRKTETEHGLNGVRDTVRTSKYPLTGEPRPHAPLSVLTEGPNGTKTDTFGYNATGTTKSRPGPTGVGQTLTWNEEDKLASTSAGTSYVDEADGDRLISRDNDGATLYLASGEIRWTKATGKLTGTRFYKHNGEIVGVRTAGALNWLSQDHNGSDVVAVSAADPKIVSHRRLDPFGKVRGQAPQNWPTTRGFIGGTTEAATGLIKLGEREYDITGGKFLSVDPLMDPDSPEHLNAYSYADNTPVTKSDPTGLAPMHCLGCGKPFDQLPPNNKPGNPPNQQPKGGTNKYHDPPVNATARKREWFDYWVAKHPFLYDFKFKVGYNPKVDFANKRAQATLDGEPYGLKVSPEVAINELRRCFNCSFPIKNGPADFPADGEFIPLDASPLWPSLVQIHADVKSYDYHPDGNGFYFVAQKRHFDDAGSVIAFNFEQDNKGDLNLRVRAWASSPVPDAANKAEAGYQWSKFAHQLGMNIIEHHCTTGVKPKC
ncbi:RHS repeat domain-containing protein [Kibdelosporangium phytohabitans]|uniref:RHS repeat domain-containing protein n=1 Tax=Kibdelosporangium phytohabitans TaxID=860235 RepID=UPI0012FAD87D|nr:RHS repeat-associated core domain-containing protein [Kibdelosporangium phytohabitans]MBE1469194.1 RHS repeat-associated protein [Kibdelosporangium phytohabitans]